MDNIYVIQISNRQKNKIMKIKQLFQSLKVDGYGGTKIKTIWDIACYQKMI